MQNNIKRFLGLSENANYDEVIEAYNSKRAQLQEDRFKEGYEGNQAARELTDLELLYRDYLDEYRFEKKSEVYADEFNSANSKFDIIKDYVKRKEINKAQEMLDDITNHNAEWNYYQAMIYYQKNWFTDSKKHLQRAVDLEPNNEKYKNALDRLAKRMSGVGDRATKTNRNPNWWQNQNPDGNKNTRDGQTNWHDGKENWDGGSQMGCGSDCATCCTSYLCANLLCSCCGSGF